MSAFTDISAALDAHCAELLLPTAWENSGFTPTEGVLYIRPTILPASTDQAGCGEGGLDEHVGLYQVDIIAPALTGKGEAVIQADIVADKFRRGTSLIYNGVSLILSKASRGAGKRDGAWFVIPVTIQYQSFTQPR